MSVCYNVIIVYRTIHFPDGGGGGVSNTTATWVWSLKGVLNTNTTKHRRVRSTITCGAFTHSFIQWLSRDSWAFRLLQPIPMVWVVISPCVINHANYSVGKIKGVGSSAPYDSPPGVPLSRQWWVQLTVAGTMSGDSSAAGHHFGFWFWQSWDSCQNVVSNQPEVWIVSSVLSAWRWLILLLCFQRSACLLSGITCGTRCSVIKSLFTSLASDISTSMAQCRIWPSTCIYVRSDL